MSEDDFEYEYDPIDGYEAEPDQCDFELENMFYEADGNIFKNFIE